jgi:AcrR family transcriptional regulator
VPDEHSPASEKRQRGRPPTRAKPRGHPGLPLELVGGLAPVQRNILMAAHDLLLERGYRALTLEGVALEAGETVGTVKKYFVSKAGLVEMLVDSLAHDTWLKVVATVESLPPGPERIHAYITAMRDVFVETEETLALFNVFPYAMRLPDLRPRLAALYRWYRELVLEKSGILALVPSGIVLTDEEAEALAGVIMAALDGLSLQAALDPEGFDVDAAIDMLDRMVRSAVAV